MSLRLGTLRVAAFLVALGPRTEAAILKEPDINVCALPNFFRADPLLMLESSLSRCYIFGEQFRNSGLQLITTTFVYFFHDLPLYCQSVAVCQLLLKTGQRHDHVAIDLGGSVENRYHEVGRAEEQRHIESGDFVQPLLQKLHDDEKRHETYPVGEPLGVVLAKGCDARDDGRHERVDVAER